MTLSGVLLCQAEAAVDLSTSFNIDAATCMSKSTKGRAGPFVRSTNSLCSISSRAGRRDGYHRTDKGTLALCS